MSQLAVVVIAILLGGCNAVFDIESTIPLDASIVDTDADDDGIADVTDNCRDIVNPTQSDEDSDGVGDLCDNCPLVANFSQGDAGDGDGVGDSCDPNIQLAGDCLVILEGFTEASAFDANWQVPGALRARVEPGAGSVAVTKGPVVPILSREITTAANVQATGRLTWMPGGALSAVTLAPSSPHGYRCTLTELGGLIASAQASNSIDPGFGNSSPLSGPNLFDPVLLRLGLPIGTPIAVRCRIDYGIAVGAAQILPTTAPPAGTGTGIEVKDIAVSLDAIAIYQHLPGGCPTTIVR